MSENDFGEIRIDFKSLADTIRNIKSEGADEDEIEEFYRELEGP